MKINVCECIGGAMIYPGISKRENDSYFCVKNYTMYQRKDIVEELKVNPDDYIKLVRVDMRRLEEYYCTICILANTMDEGTYDELERLRKESPKKYDIAFRKWVEYSGLNWDWSLVSRSIIITEIIHWCEDNKIEYEVKKLSGWR